MTNMKSSYALALAAWLYGLGAGATADAALAAETADRVPTIYGSVIYATGWGDLAHPPYGIYAITNGDATQHEAVKLDPKLFANGGGVYIDGKYHLSQHTTYADGISVALRTYDVNDGWRLLREKYLDTTGAIATDLAYDPTEDRIYGCFGLSSSGEVRTYRLGILDEYAGEVEEIAPLDEELLTLACSRDGELYGIGAYGNLYHVDKQTAKLTVVGSTGQNIKYTQSATFDYASGRLFWVATPHGTDHPVYLYEVNTADGSVTMLSEVKDRYEFTGLFTTAPFTLPDAPGRMSVPRADFPQGATSGTIVFDAPVSTFGGATLEGTLSYRIRIDNEEAGTGSCAPGATVSLPATLTSGAHLLKVDVSNAAGRSPIADAEVWIGADVPVSAHVEGRLGADGKVELTWEAAQGLHGGYIDADAITYRVVRQPDGVCIYKGTDTHCTEAEVIRAYGVYSYDVESWWGSQKGGVASSPEMVLGEAAEVPYQERFNSAAALGAYTIIDANADETTWHYDAGTVVYSYDEGGNAADDWLITPPFRLDPEYLYEISADASTTDGYSDLISIHLAPRPEAESMERTLLPTTAITSSDAQTLAARFRPDGTDLCFIGFHAESTYETGDCLTLDNVSLIRKASIHAPAAPEDLTAEAAPEGGLQATIRFRLPDYAIDGAPLASLSSVSLYRGKQLVGTIDDCAPGQTLFLADEPSLTGNYTYSVVAANEWGKGLEAATTVYVGEDTPGEVTNILLTDRGNGTVRLTWDAPTLGIHGGYIDPAKVKYEVTDAAGNTATLTACTYEPSVDVPAEGQSMTWFSIRPRSLKGKGPICQSDTLFLGRAFAMPFEESFSHRGLDFQPWNLQELDGVEWSLMGYGSYADPQDADGGMVAFINALPEGGAKLVSPKISLSGAHPTLRFWMFHHPLGRNALTVQLRDADGGLHTLGQLQTADTAEEQGEWQLHTFGLEDYEALGDVQLIFRGESHLSEALMNAFYIDHISVIDWLGHDLQVLSLETPAKSVKVGETLRFTLSYANRGSLPAAGYDVRLLRDGREVCRVAGETLEPDAEGAVVLTDVPNSDAKESSIYEAEIVWEADQLAANNRTAPLTVTVLPGLPYVETLRASVEDGACVLRWEAPDMGDASAPAEEVTEDFESYTAFTIENIGQWTLYDGDGRITTGIQDGHGNYIEYDNVGLPMAYQVFCPAQAGLGSGVWSPHSGNQVLAAFTTGRYAANDDWLISPRAEGGQTVRFWAKSPDHTYYGTNEVIQTLYSTSGTAASDFVQVGADITVPGVWQEYAFDIPDDARYFAIRCVSADQYILFLDDITYRRSAGTLQLLGYHVYRDGVCLTSAPLAEPSYRDADCGDAVHRYQVSVVYNEGESILSPAVEASLSAVQSVSASPVLSYRTGSGWIEIMAPANLDVRLTDALGRTLFQGRGSCRLTLPAGIYLLNGQKVLVRQ